ncbi:hypothetical protein F511_02525 [Dorcoceras hygrometricum]|nr:hypothetical protein F511_02525 [Dorcoceras hygrometricum]
MLLHFGSVPTLIVSSADMAREILKSHDVAFPGRPSSYIAKKLAYNSSLSGINRGIFIPICLRSVRG